MPDLHVFHIVPSEDVWAVKRQGATRASRLAPTREHALAQAKNLTRRSYPARIVLHRDDGTIESQISVDEGAPRDLVYWLTSPPVLVGIAGALIVSGVAALFAARR